MHILQKLLTADMRKLIKAQTRRGVQLDGVLFDKSGERTVAIAITGIHGNFYSNPMFIELINSHMRYKDENEVIFVEGTGHVYTEREQMLADIILRLVRK